MEDRVEDGVVLVLVMSKNERVYKTEMGSILGNHPEFYIGIRVTALATSAPTKRCIPEKKDALTRVTSAG